MYISMETFIPAEPTTNFEEDIEYATKYSRWILSSIGVWPKSRNNITEKCISNFAWVIGNLALSFSIVPCILYIIYEEKDTYERMKLLGLSSFCISAMIKYFALYARRSDIECCYECLQNDWRQVCRNYKTGERYEKRNQRNQKDKVKRPSDRELMMKYARIGRKLTVICAVFMYTGGLIYHTICPFTRQRVIDEFNRTLKPLVYPSYTALYDAQRSPIYEFVFVAHFFCGYVMYSVTIGAYGLAATFAMHACGQINIVMSRIEDLPRNGEGNEEERITCASGKLVAIVEHHSKVLRFGAMLEQLLREICLVEFIGSTFLICFLEYYCIMDWKSNNTISLFTYMVLLISLSFNIFILCYVGECLTTQTGKVGSKCFSIDWYNLSGKISHGTILISAMSNKPVKITAGRMAELSISSFGNILKTSVAYLNFLRVLVM